MTDRLINAVRPTSSSVTSGDRSGGLPHSPNGVSEFRILEIVDDRALIQSPLDVPGAYPRQGGPQTASINHTA